MTEYIPLLTKPMDFKSSHEVGIEPIELGLVFAVNILEMGQFLVQYLNSKTFSELFFSE
jgi:hypothetical protein